MKTFLITDASTIDKLNLVIFRVAGSDQAIFRSPKQIAQDLKKSGMFFDDVDSVFSVSDRRIAKHIPDLIGGKMLGDVILRKKGDEYTVTETSGVMQEGHPEFGDHAVGDVLTVKEDHFRVEGFLTLRREASIEESVRVAEAKAELSNAYANMFAQATGTTPGADAEVDPESIDPAILAEAGIGTGEPKSE